MYVPEYIRGLIQILSGDNTPIHKLNLHVMHCSDYYKPM